MSRHGPVASVFWIFMRLIVSQQCPLMPQTGTSRSLLNLVRTRVAVDAVEGVAEVAG